MSDNHAQPHMQFREDLDDELPPQEPENRMMTIIVGAGSVAVLVGIVVALVLWPSGETDGDVQACQSFIPKASIENCSLEGTVEFSGTVTDVDDLVVSVSGGLDGLGGESGEILEFTVRDDDTAVINMDHIAQHAALAQPVDVYYRDEAGTKTIVFITDAFLEATDSTAPDSPAPPETPNLPTEEPPPDL